ncbi:hypothetical protein OG194_32125 [Streptomyces sp. NBC_01288]|uniref:MmyB family transcriptional regulator n=1 Tax=Streptomyces sp. NBC_01288 TaxID=2903814 RepID=UPI002E14AAFF|nr:hypothetical protein OG194_32125 [Streptomyces sp. NBC_01288]
MRAWPARLAEVYAAQGRIDELRTRAATGHPAYGVRLSEHALPHRERNLVRFMFRDEAARSLYTHWDIHAHDIVASLRRDAGRHPHDPLPAEPVGELSVADEGFRRWWADRNVHRHTHGSKHFHHPIVGPLTLNYECLTLPADPDQRLSVYTAEAGSSSEEALRLPAAWIRRPETSHGQHADHRTPAGHPGSATS